MNPVAGMALVAAHNSVQGMPAAPYRSFEEALSMFLIGISLIAFSLILKPRLRRDDKMTTQMNSKETCCRTSSSSPCTSVALEVPGRTFHLPIA
jgi:hypothetical protein